MFYDPRDRRWYTKEEVDDPLLASDASQAVPFTELISQTTDVLGEVPLIPKKHKDGDQEFVQIRLKMGLFVEVWWHIFFERKCAQ